MLRRVVELYNAQGWKPIVAPEMEFFLVARNIDPAQPVEPPMGRSGRRAAARQAYSMSAVDEYGPVIDDIYDFAEAQGFEIDGILQEGGAGPGRDEPAPRRPGEAGRRDLLLQALIREAALRHDCFATFMAKPIEDEPGSAMHIHHSVVDTEDGPRTSSPTTTAARREAFLHFIARHAEAPAQRDRAAGALREHLPPLRPRTSRRRSTWNGAATTAPPGIRVPISEPASAPGREPARGDGLQPLSRHRGLARLRLSGADAEDSTPRPRSPATPMTARRRSRGVWARRWTCSATPTKMREVLGEEFARVYMAVKGLENSEFLQVISPWEREHLLLNV